MLSVSEKDANNKTSSSKLNTSNHLSSSSSSSSWGQTHHILLAIIVLQGCFMVFMSLEGPSASVTWARASPRHTDRQFRSHKGWKNRNRRSHKIEGGLVQEENGNEPSEEQRGDDANSAADTKKTIVRSQTKKVPRKPKAAKTTSPPQYKDSLQSKQWQVNMQDFPGALHFHFEQERLDPFFRTNQLQTITMESLKQQANQDALDAAKLMVRKNQELTPCVYYVEDSNNQGIPRMFVNKKCFKFNAKGKGTIIYNSLDFARTWCGKTIPPHAVVNMRKVCDTAPTEVARVLLHDNKDKIVEITRKQLMQLPPIVLKRKDSYATVEAVKDCDVPCKASMDTCVSKDGDNQNVKGEVCLPQVADWTVEGTDFKFRYSQVDPRVAPSDIFVSRKAYRDNQYYVTRSFQSEIPLSSFDWDRYGEMKNAPRPDFAKSGKKGVAFIHLEPCSGEIRPGNWAGKVQEGFSGTIDYYGPCNLGGTFKPTETTLDLKSYQDRQSIMSEYMFTLVIGSSQTPDMVSELVWDALTAGSIPVYHGAPNIREHVPPNSILVGAEYSSQKALGEYLEKIRSTESLWQGLHAWRDEEGTPLEDKYGFLKDKSSSTYCRMCRWALATKYALGWNHQTQKIQKPAVERKFCTSPKELLKMPVEEVWMTDMSTETPWGKRVCGKTVAFQTISFDDVAITRRVFSHDNGVVDFAITDVSSLRTTLKVVLRLTFRNEIANAGGAHILNPHQLLTNKEKPFRHIPLVSSIAIQDDKTRATILTNWITDIKTPKQGGLVDILVKDLTKSIDPPAIDKDAPPKKGKDGLPLKTKRLMEDEVLRIRIIIEDVNRLRDAHTEFSVSPYAKHLMADFLEPLAFYHIK